MTNAARNRPSRPFPEEGAPAHDNLHYAVMHAPASDLSHLSRLLRKKNAPVTGPQINHALDLANPTGVDVLPTTEAERAANRDLF